MIISSFPTTRHDHNHEDGDEDDDHARDGMMIEHFGSLHAGLTVRTVGGTPMLELKFETVSGAKPVAVPLAKISGKVTRPGSTTPVDVTFEPTPASDRPGEAAGSASCYRVDVPWLTANAKLSVTIAGDYKGKPRRATWLDFDTAKFRQP